jgi:hypothetical protein
MVSDIDKIEKVGELFDILIQYCKYNGVEYEIHASFNTKTVNHRYDISTIKET